MKIYLISFLLFLMNFIQDAITTQNKKGKQMLVHSQINVNLLKSNI